MTRGNEPTLTGSEQVPAAPRPPSGSRRVEGIPYHTPIRWRIWSRATETSSPRWGRTLIERPDAGIDYAYQGEDRDQRTKLVPLAKPTHRRGAPCRARRRHGPGRHVSLRYLPRQAGDTSFEVLKKCGRPASQQQISGANERFVEQWYYEPGPGAFQRILTFVGTRLVNIETVTRPQLAYRATPPHRKRPGRHLAPAIARPRDD
ncbi:MAG: DUF2845 domain-containing protein [Pseudomonadota bacterium]|nr:DUF2845 domain-containing protein [Pseudomonadota bacterium]